MDKDDKAKSSRMSRLLKQGLQPSFPDIKQGKFILDLMSDIGWSKQGAMGLVPLDWVDIKAFSDLTGIIFTKDESILIKKLSENFVSQMHDSKYTDTYAPYLDEREKDNGMNCLFNSIL
jgi:hypothetical protein